MPMMRGATPTAAAATTRAFGVRPCRRAPASEARNSAHAPSFTPEALPAVTVPPGFTMGFSFERASRVVSGRECSSTENDVVFPGEGVSPFFPATGTATISSPMRQLRIASAARCWLRSAKATRSPPEIPNPSATIWPVSGMESVPYFAFISGLTKRQPMVVSSNLIERENAASALPTTKGARDMLSTPPAITKSASPLLIARAGLSRPTEDDAIEVAPTHLGVSRHQRRDGDGGEVVGANGGKGAAVAADRRAGGGAGVGVGRVGGRGRVLW